MLAKRRDADAIGNAGGHAASNSAKRGTGAAHNRVGPTVPVEKSPIAHDVVRAARVGDEPESARRFVECEDLHMGIDITGGHVAVQDKELAGKRRRYRHGCGHREEVERQQDDDAIGSQVICASRCV